MRDRNDELLFGMFKLMMAAFASDFFPAGIFQHLYQLVGIHQRLYMSVCNLTHLNLGVNNLCIRV